MSLALVANTPPMCWNASLAFRLRGDGLDGKSVTGNRTDLRLMESIKAGDAAALETLYARYARTVLGVCRRILGDPRDAEEAMLDAFAQIWEQGDRYDPGRASPLSYLMTVARSRAIDRARAVGRVGRWISDEDEGLLGDLDRDDPAPAGPLSSLLSAESRGVVEAALGRLPADQREAVELAFFEGLSHREVADRLAAPLGTVKTRIRQGLIRLRDGLDPAAREGAP
jgi:RNA polymerase sigma-70 factor (ECF subfamily)